MKCLWEDEQILMRKNEVFSVDSIINDEEFEDILNFIAKKWSLDSFGDESGVFPFALPCEDEIIFYPGSFSPWHKGHGACVRNAPKNLPLVVMPDYNPWKEVRKEGMWQEVQTIWRDLSELEKSGHRVSLFLGFLALKKRNPTVKWMSYFKEVHPQKKVWLLMGEDSFLHLHEWYRAQELLSLLHGIYICPRGEEEDQIKKQREVILKMAEKPIMIERLSSHPYEHFSSTFLRESR
ncbi:MAG: hypothetical protein VXV96_08775 [Bdellovibrionota bacterium]|nr:hypothetical protein [Bdellovibrionota bacterium]